MSWKDQLRSDSLPWLLESENPGVRYLALRDVIELPAEDRELKSARKSAHKEGPIAVVLSNMEKEDIGSSRVPVITRNTVQPPGPSFCWRSLAHQSTKINASSKPVKFYWIIWRRRSIHYGFLPARLLER